MVSAAYLRLLIFLLAILILARASSSPAFLRMYAAYKLKKQDDNKYSFPYLEPVCCSMPSSYCCFLTSIQISQEADKMVWYSHLLKNFLQFVVIYTVKGFGVVNKAEVDVFLGLFHILIIQHMLEIWSLVPLPFLFFYFLTPLPFLNPAWTSGSSQFMYCWSLAWRILSNTLLGYEMSKIVW